MATSQREKKANLSRNQAWNLWLLARLNSCYWQDMNTLAAKRARQINNSALATGIVAAAMGRAFEGFGLAVGTACLTGFSQILRGKISEKMTERTRRYFERWTCLRHDAETVWNRGETLGWGCQDVQRDLAVLREQERQYHSQEVEAPNKNVLESCQRRLWEELGVPYPEEPQREISDARKANSANSAAAA